MNRRTSEPGEDIRVKGRVRRRKLIKENINSCAPETQGVINYSQQAASWLKHKPRLDTSEPAKFRRRLTPDRHLARLCSRDWMVTPPCPGSTETFFALVDCEATQMVHRSACVESVQSSGQ